MKKLLQWALIASTFITSEQGIKAQTAPPKLWEKSIGGSRMEYLYSSQPTSDGGYILGGWSDSQISGDKSQARRGSYYDYWAVKLDASGNKQWDKTFGGNSTDALTCIKQTSDGGFVLGGYTNSGLNGDKTEASKGGNDYWIVKIDAAGNKQWDRTIGGSLEESLMSLQQTSDGGYILGGTSTSNISGDKTQASKGAADYWIVKLNASGNKLWDKTIGGSSNDIVGSIEQTTDGGFIVGGTSNSGISGDKSQAGAVSASDDYWIVRLDVVGFKLWDKTFSGNGTDQLYALQQTRDGGYILGGQSTSDISGDKSEQSKGFVDFWLIKVNDVGTKQWDKTFGGSSGDFFMSLDQTADGGYILGGPSHSPISGDKSESQRGYADFWAVKIDYKGAKVWDKTFGGTDGNDELQSIHENTDGSYFLAGYSHSGVNGDKTQPTKGDYDYWVIKLKSPCADFSATLSTSCVNGNQSVFLNVASVPNLVWTLNYKLDGVNKTVTSASSTTSLLLSSNVAATSVFEIVNVTSGTCTANLTSSPTLTVYPIPPAPQVLSAERCGAGTVILLAAGAPSGSNYLWYNLPSGGTLLSNNASGAYAAQNLNTTTNFYVAVENNNGCEGPRSLVTATIKTMPSVTVGANQSICATASPIQLTGFSPAGGTWSGAGVNSTGLFTPASNLIGNQTLTYTATQNGCSASATQVITVTAPPIVNAGASETICANASPVQLSGFSPAGGAWSGSGVNATGTFTPGSNLVGNQTLTYTVTQNGCSVSGTKQVTVPVIIAQPTINLISPDTLISSVAGSSYIWKLNNTTLPTATRKLKATASGNYSVQVKDANNCTSGFSPDYSFIISGLKEMNSAEVRIYPNPTKGLLNLEFAEPINASVKVYNTLGQCILVKAVSKQEKEINLELTNAVKGIYTIQVTSENQSLIKKIVLE